MSSAWELAFNEDMPNFEVQDNDGPEDPDAIMNPFLEGSLNHYNWNNEHGIITPGPPPAPIIHHTTQPTPLTAAQQATLENFLAPPLAGVAMQLAQAQHNLMASSYLSNPNRTSKKYVPDFDEPPMITKEKLVELQGLLSSYKTQAKGKFRSGGTADSIFKGLFSISETLMDYLNEAAESVKNMADLQNRFRDLSRRNKDLELDLGDLKQNHFDIKEFDKSATQLYKILGIKNGPTLKVRQDIPKLIDALHTQFINYKSAEPDLP